MIICSILRADVACSYLYLLYLHLSIHSSSTKVVLAVKGASLLVVIVTSILAALALPLIVDVVVVVVAVPVVKEVVTVVVEVVVVMSSQYNHPDRQTDRQILTYRNTGVSLQGHRQETGMACCRSDPGSAGSDVWKWGPPLWACLLLPWRWSEAGSPAGCHRAAGHVGTPNMADRCRLEGKKIKDHIINNAPPPPSINKKVGPLWKVSTDDVSRCLTLLLLRLLHTGSEETHQLPLFYHWQLTTCKHIGSAAGYLRDRTVVTKNPGQQRDREDNRETNITTERQQVSKESDSSAKRDSKISGKTNRSAERQTGQQGDRQDNREVNRETDRMIERHVSQQRDRQVRRNTGRPTERQTGQNGDRQVQRN